MTEEERAAFRLGYTIGSGKLFTDFPTLHKEIERIMGRPVWTHELASQEVNDAICRKAEAEMMKELQDAEA
jgi:hypothetical protein